MEPGANDGAALGHCEQTADEGRKSHRHVDEEDRPPPEVLEEPSAEQRPGGGPDPTHTGPDPDRSSTVVA